MTSGNVANLLTQAMGGISLDISTKQTDMAISTGNTFDKALQSASEIKGSGTLEKTKVVDGSEKPMDEKSFENKISESKIKDSKVDKKEKLSPEEEETLVETVEAFMDEVKAVLKEELNVTDEEIESAMEILGLTAADLIEPQNLVDLVMNVTQETDNVTLLISEEFNLVFDEVSKLVSELLEVNDINPVELKDIMISFEQQIDIKTEEVVENSIKEVENKQEVIVETSADESVENKPVEETDSFVASEEEIENPYKTEAIKTETADDNSFEQHEGNPDIGKKNIFEAKGSEIQDRAENPIGAVNSFEHLEFSPVDEAVALPDGQRINVSDMIEQIVEQAKILNDAEITTMEMTLNPAGLGKIFMEVTQKGDEITAKLFAENEVVKEALESQMATLRNQLSDTSTKVTSIEVSVGAHEFERNLEEDNRQQQNSEEQARRGHQRRTRIDMNSLDELSGLMTEEELLVAQIMRENGNTLNYQA